MAISFVKHRASPFWRAGFLHWPNGSTGRRGNAASDAACGDDASSDDGNDASSSTGDGSAAARVDVAERLAESRDATRAEGGAEGGVEGGAEGGVGTAA